MPFSLNHQTPKEKESQETPFVSNPYFELIFLLVSVRVPVPQHLPCNEAIQRRCTKVCEKENTVASFLYRRKDANQCTKEQHKTCYGRKLASALVLVVGGCLDQLQQKTQQYLLSAINMEGQDTSKTLGNKTKRPTEHCFSPSPIPLV
jgi:hypothetical protein